MENTIIDMNEATDDDQEGPNDDTASTQHHVEKQPEHITRRGRIVTRHDYKHDGSKGTTHTQFSKLARRILRAKYDNKPMKKLKKEKKIESHSKRRLNRYWE